MSNQSTAGQPAQQAQVNRITLDSLLKEAETLGADNGKGKDSWSKFLYRCIEGGYHGAIDLTRDKHGVGIDDAHMLTERWVKGQTGAVIYDHKAGNARKAAACVRKVTQLGGWTKGGQGEPLATVNTLLTMRGKAKAQPQLAKQLDDPSNTLLRFAREQVKRDQLIPEDELKQFIFKAKGDMATGEEIIQAARKSLQNLISGKASQGTAQDASSLVKEAVEKLTLRLAEIAKAKAPLPTAKAATTKAKVA